MNHSKFHYVSIKIKSGSYFAQGLKLSKFHYVSIKMSKIRKSVNIAKNSKFHYVSIKIKEKARERLLLCTLNSTMFLLRSVY